MSTLARETSTPVVTAYDYFLTTPTPSPDAGPAVSAREAYQLLLHGRATLIDLRTDRRASIDPALPQEHLSTADLPAWLLRRAPGPEERRLLVLADYNVQALEAISWLHRHGHTDVGYLAGGITAWAGQGMPTG